MIDIRIKIIIGVVWSILLFAAGWRIEYWHYSAQREGEVTAAMKQQNANMTTLIDAHNKEVTHIDSLNLATTQDQVHTQLLIQEQNDAIARVNEKLANLRVGSCTLNGTADSVLLDAYKAAFPSAAPARKAKH